MENTGEKQGGRTLIIRSGPSWLFEKTLAIVGGKQGSRIDVYCPKSVTPQLAGRKDIESVFDYNWEGFYKYSFITAELVGKLSARRYEHVIIMYNDAFGEGYGPFRKLAFKIKPGAVSSVNINMLFSGLASEGVLGRFFLPRKWFYNVMIAIFTVEIVTVTVWDRVKFALKKALRIRAQLPTKHKR